MGIDCGSQVVLCEYPIHLDTYGGCSHGCRYCFAQRKQDIGIVKPHDCAKAVKAFTEGKRGATTNWCDWPIPLHWGGLSDPFQPAERKYGASLNTLRVLAETGYPVIISTKGELICEQPYIDLLAKCNAVVQISMVCSSYDKLEKGAPSFERRLEMLKELNGRCKRLIVRAQPYMVEVHREFLANVPRFAEAGAYGVTVEGMKFARKKPGLVRVGGDFCYQDADLRKEYERIRRACDEAGLRFYCAENRLRHMGESTACCGCGDLEGFAGNAFNVVSLMNGARANPTERMRQPNTGSCFHSLNQTAGTSRQDKEKPFAQHMVERLRGNGLMLGGRSG